MITITAPGKATQQHCERLRPRGLEGCIVQVPPLLLSCATRRWWSVDSRMACFVVVVPDSVAVVVCRSSASGRVLVCT